MYLQLKKIDFFKNTIYNYNILFSVIYISRIPNGGVMTGKRGTTRRDFSPDDYKKSGYSDERFEPFEPKFTQWTVLQWSRAYGGDHGMTQPLTVPNHQRPAKKWKLDQKQRLILSILQNDPIGTPLIGIDPVTNIWYLNDGLQRHTVLREFLNNEWSFTFPSRKYMEDVFRHNECLDRLPRDNRLSFRFSELPATIRKGIENTTIWVSTGKASREKLRDMYLKANNGTSLRPEDKVRAGLCEVPLYRDTVIEIIDTIHLFSGRANLADNGLTTRVSNEALFDPKKLDQLSRGRTLEGIVEEFVYLWLKNGGFSAAESTNKKDFIAYDVLNTHTKKPRVPFFAEESDKLGENLTSTCKRIVQDFRRAVDVLSSVYRGADVQFRYDQRESDGTYKSRYPFSCGAGKDRKIIMNLYPSAMLYFVKDILPDSLQINQRHLLYHEIEAHKARLIDDHEAGRGDLYNTFFQSQADKDGMWRGYLSLQRAIESAIRGTNHEPPIETIKPIDPKKTFDSIFIANKKNTAVRNGTLSPNEVADCEGGTLLTELWGGQQHQTIFS